MLLRRTLEHLWARGYGDGPVDRYTYPVLVLLDSHGPMPLTELTCARRLVGHGQRDSRDAPGAPHTDLAGHQGG